MASKHINLPSAFSEGDPTEWFQRFDICSTANDWDDTMKAKKLPTLLEGEALAIWLELSQDKQKDYGEAKKRIVSRMAPLKFISMDEETSNPVRRRGLGYLARTVARRTERLRRSKKANRQPYGTHEIHFHG